MSHNISVRWADHPGPASTSHSLQMRCPAGSSTPRKKWMSGLGSNQWARPLSGLLRRFYRVVNFHVHGLVVRVGGDMGFDAPIEVCGKQFVGLGEKPPEVAAVVNLTGAQLPARPQLSSQNIVDTSELEFSHVVNVIFAHCKMVNGGRRSVVQLRFQFDSGVEI